MFDLTFGVVLTLKNSSKKLEFDLRRSCLGLQSPFLSHMAWQKGQRIPTNLIIGFLGSGKTTAIGKLIDSRPTSEKWSIFINEYGMVSIDQAIVDAGSEDIAVQELGGGCACCTMAFAFQPLLAQFIRRTRPDRLILEPSGASHPAKVIDVLRSSNFSSVIDLRNTIKGHKHPTYQDRILHRSPEFSSGDKRLCMIVNFCDWLPKR